MDKLFNNAQNIAAKNYDNVIKNKPFNIKEKLNNISEYGKGNNQYIKEKISEKLNQANELRKSMDESIKKAIRKKFKLVKGWSFDSEYYNFENSIQILKDALNIYFVPKNPKLAKLLACNHIILVKKHINSAFLDVTSIYASSFKNIIDLQGDQKISDANQINSNNNDSNNLYTLHGGTTDVVIKPGKCVEPVDSKDIYKCLTYGIYDKIYNKLLNSEQEMKDIITQETIFSITKMANQISGRQPSTLDYITGNKSLNTTTENSDFLNNLNNAIEYDLKYKNVLKNKSYNRIVKTHFNYYLKKLNMKDLKIDIQKGGIPQSLRYGMMRNKGTAGEEDKIDELIKKGKEVPPLIEEEQIYSQIKTNISIKRFNEKTLNKLKEKYEKIIKNMISNFPMIEVYMSLTFIYYNITKNVTKEEYKKHRFYTKCIYAIEVILQNIRNQLLSDYNVNPFEKKMLVDKCDKDIKKTLDLFDRADFIEECIERKILSYYCNTLNASMSHLKAYFQLTAIESLHAFFLKHYPEDKLAQVTFELEAFQYCNDMEEINNEFVTLISGGSHHTRRLRSNPFNKTRHVLHSKKRTTNRIHKNNRKTKKK